MSDIVLGSWLVLFVDLHLKLTQDLHLKLTHPEGRIMA